MKATIDIARKHSMVAATQTVFGGAKAGRQMAKKQNQVAFVTMVCTNKKHSNKIKLPYVTFKSLITRHEVQCLLVGKLAV